MVVSAPFQPEWVSAPGEIISDCLRMYDLSRTDFAARLGCRKGFVAQLLRGGASIDHELAERLHRILGGSIKFWLNREMHYRDDMRRLNILKDPKASSDWLRELPVRDMIQFGWIQPRRQPPELALECLRFFNEPSVISWRHHNTIIANAVAFRSARAFESRPGAVAAWLRRGEVEATAIECDTWNPKAFRERLQAVRALTRRKNPAFFLPHLKQICAECGVAVVLVPAPTGCRASGATKFISPTKALLLLSFRYKSDDHFWFTFFHEAGHLLLHDRGALFVEGPEMLSTSEEEEANAFSANTLVPPLHQDEMCSLGSNYRAIMRFARHIGVAPGIIVGQLQHRQQIGRNQMNFLKRRFVWQNEGRRVIPERV